jgi:hypothetical protein
MKYTKEYLAQNNITITHPEIAAEWHTTLNGDDKAENYTKHNSVNIWWICNNHHEYQATISHRLRGDNCPYCSGHRIILGQTDLLTRYPILCREWDYNKNTLGPEHYAQYSNKKCWWICQYGHKWETSIDKRTRRKQGCPYCSGHKHIMGQTDLATLHPELCKEWDYTKNIHGPKIYPQYSNNKVWWICNKCQHSWCSIIADRVIGHGCPRCNISKGENKIEEYLNKYNIVKIIQQKFNDCKYKKMLPFDFYLPEYNLCIEYNGVQHYQIATGFYNKTPLYGLMRLRKQKQHDRIKRHYCRDNHINYLCIPYTHFDDIEEILDLALAKIKEDDKI